MPILMGMKFLKAHSQHLAMPEPSYYVIAKSSWFCMVWTSFPPQWQSTSKIWPNLALMLITHTCINSNNFANTASYQLNKLSSTSPTFSPNMWIKDYTTIWRGKGEAANAERLWQYRAASVKSKQKLSSNSLYQSFSGSSLRKLKLRMPYGGGCGMFYYSILSSYV